MLLFLNVFLALRNDAEDSPPARPAPASADNSILVEYGVLQSTAAVFEMLNKGYSKALLGGNVLNSGTRMSPFG